MLKRISQITNIGRFKSLSAGGEQFDKITLIYGLNTYGKSTLGDLFSSIESGDLSAITTRKTIPNDGRPQEAEFSFMAEGQSETAIRLTSNTWHPALPAGLHIRVLDDGFYHKNVFAARQFTRNTKENFSSFVLGAQGVAKAHIIAERKSKKRAATQDRNRLQTSVFKNIIDLDNFLQLSPTLPIETLKELVDDLRRENDDLNKQKQNAEKIQNRKELTSLRWIMDFSEALENFNNTLQSSLKNHHNDARQKVSEHIQKNFKVVRDAERWIRQGLEQNNGERCQFCGQVLSEDALQLLEVYRRNFDESFQEHENKIKQALFESKSVLTKNRVSSLSIALERNGTALVSYPELEGNTAFQNFKEKIKQIDMQLKDKLEAWEQQQQQLIKNIESLIDRKLASPHVALEKLQQAILLQLDENVNGLIDNYNTTANKLMSIIREFKSSVRDVSFDERIDKIKTEAEAKSLEIRRLELNEPCTEYIALSSEVNILGEEIPRLQDELRVEQSSFLDQFYCRLNKYFKDFGSSDFLLEKGEDTSGHTPVYYLKVKFYNQDIPERDLQCVFGESDRRALALSVFFAGLTTLSEDELLNTIVVLDDPVTSFDNNRMTAVHKEIVNLSDKVRQIIILSHFEQGVAKFLSTYRNTKPVKLLSIERNAGTSNLHHMDIVHFIRSEHEKARENILKFVSEESSDHNAGDLRIFLEYEINNRFAKQLRANNINEQDLSDRINRLKAAGAISDDVANEAHGWRETLNPNHHIWTGSNIEDKRNTATQFIDFIYHRLKPA